MSGFVIIRDLSGNDGDYPAAGLTKDAEGNLFGTASGGGATGDGTIFELVDVGPGFTFQTLYSFDASSGYSPMGNLLIDAKGDLFGTTELTGPSGPYGTVYELVNDGGGNYTHVTLATFDGSDGDAPYGGLYEDSAGNLFGTTAAGGTSDDGTVFEIPRVKPPAQPPPQGSPPFTGYGNTPITLVNFNGPNGNSAYGALIGDANGDLFGTTDDGGANGAGTVFELVNQGDGNFGFVTVFSFTGVDGGGSTSTLLADANGDLFGTTRLGGPSVDGVVFELINRGGGVYDDATLLDFGGANGANPDSGLIADAKGDLFGTTPSGGANGSGTAFELVSNGDGSYTPRILHSFDGTDGQQPQDSLVADAQGNLFGTAYVGGSQGTGTLFALTDTGFETCFLSGTMIATPTGEVPIERVSAGDFILTAHGKIRPVIWVGTGHVLATSGRRSAATPVIIRKGAMHDNVPNRDLHVTKAHALYVDGTLIPAAFLVNHRSILWDDHAGEVTIYHIELQSHDILLANGAPAESYRDDGNRWLFRNANSGWGLPPQEPCVAVITGGSLVDAAWRRLLDRAGPRPGLPLTDDADLHLQVDGQRIDAAERRGGKYLFRLAPRLGAVRIVSRAAAPQELGLARDPRLLGVAIRRIVMRQGTRETVIGAVDATLTEAFHSYEHDNDYRWTNGNAAVPVGSLSLFTGAFELALHIGDIARYIDDGRIRRAA